MRVRLPGLTQNFDNVCFTGDTHFDHGNIIKYCNRPFLADIDKKAWEENGKSWHRGDWKGAGSSQWKISREAIDWMNTTLIDNTNKMVGQDDILIHVGDYSFGHRQYYESCKAFRNRINCRNVYFIWGNHDKRQIANLFSGCYDLVEIDVDDQRIVLCHYAMAVWNKSHRGAWQLYGHSHSGLEPWIDKALPGHRSMDVGVDNAYKILGEFRPFRFQEIGKIMKSRDGFFADHHGNKKSLVTGPTEESVIEAQDV